MKLKTAGFGLAVFLWGIGSGVFAEPKITLRTDYYLVEGQTGRQLKDQMRDLGPSGYWGYSEWKIRWNSACVLRVNIIYTLPKLRARADVPSAVLTNWDVMMVALLRHERGHGNFAVKAAREVEAKACKDTPATLAKWTKRNADYESRTDHGRLDGVALPD